jgi:hypothetical protein
MPYSINNYYGQPVATVADGTVNRSFSIGLIGKNYAGYGTTFNENFYRLLENFAGPSAPKEPAVLGQVWYDSTSDLLKLKYYTGTKWNTLAVNNITTVTNATAPANSKLGDFWYDKITNRLSIHNGTEYVLVGQQSILGFGTTQMRSRSVKANGSNTLLAIVEAVVNGVTTYIISSNPDFTLDNSINTILGFSLIRTGITLANSETGATSSADRFWGTASNADKLGGRAASDYALSTNTSFSTLTGFADVGLTVGTEFKIFNDQGITPTLVNQLGDTIVFKVTYNGSQITPLKLVGRDALPGITDYSNLGSPLLKFGSIYATNFYGITDKADSLNVGGVYRTASSAVGPNTIVVRDNTGRITGAVDTSAEAVKLQNIRNINGVGFDGTQSITVPFDANQLTGTNIKSTVLTSSLTTVGTLTNLRTSGYIKFPVYSDATARNTAIPSPEAGMVVFITLTSKFQGYNGSAWTDLN